MGGLLSKALTNDDLVDFNIHRIPFPCLSHINDSDSVLYHENFKELRNLLFDAVGFNSRDIYRKLLVDYYSTSTHVSLTTLQDMFGAQSIKAPKSPKRQKETQYVNILIKSGEFERDGCKHAAFFLVVSLKSNRSLKMVSRVVELHSLKVEWNDYLSIPIQIKKDLKDELIIEVGNFYNLTPICNSAITAFEQSSNINAMRKVVLETSNTTSRQMLCKSKGCGKISIDDEFLGDSHDLALKVKKNGDKMVGEVHLQVEISEVPSKEFMEKEHEVVNQLGLMHDNEINNGSYLTLSTEAILEQHRKLTHLSTFESLLVQWITLSKIQNVFPFEYSVVDNAILKLHQFIFDTEVPHSLLAAYNSATKLILTLTLKRILEFGNDNHAINVLTKILTIKPHGKKEHYPHLAMQTTTAITDDLKKKLEEAITTAVTSWWNQRTKGVSMESLKEVTNFLDDMQEYRERLVQAYSDLFTSVVHMNLDSYLEKGLLKEIKEGVVSILEEISHKLNQESGMIDQVLSELVQREAIKKYFENLVRALDNDVKERGVYLFVVLKKLQSIEGRGTFDNLSHIASSFWIQEAISKAMTCIERAVDLDNFTPIDENVHYSSSSVDFLGIIQELQIFWKDISALTQMSQEVDLKMCQAVTKVTQLFVHLSIKKLDALINSRELSESYLSLWITFVHNIHHIKRYLVQDLWPATFQKQDACLEDILLELKVDKGFAIHLVCNIQHEMGIGKCIDEFLYDELKINYENMFATLFEEFRHALDFKELCEEIWIESLNFFDQIVDKAIETGAHIEFYCHLHETFKRISHICTKTVNDSSLEFMIDKALERKLFLNSTESDDLIEQYYIERYKAQSLETSRAAGTLTVSIKRKPEELEISILSVKDLVPVEWKTSCDPYVKVRFVPLAHFKHTDIKFQTKAKSKTTCALFDETFNVEISKINAHGSNFMHFMVIEKELMVSVYLGESFLPLNECLHADESKGETKQLHLKLTKPNEDSEIIKALEYREHHDKVAKDFLKHLKSHMNHGSWAMLQHHLHSQHSISDFIHAHTKNHHS